MGRILKPMVRGGGWYPSKKWIPLVKNGGYTTQNGGDNVNWAKVSGVSPLSLPNALAHFINSLRQIGKCTVSGTDITCNNGVLKYGATGKNLLNDNISSWTIDGGAYAFLGDVVPSGSIAIMSFTDRDTSIDVSDVSIGFVNEDTSSGAYAAQYRWAMQNGNIKQVTSNVSQLNNTILCSNVMVYPKTADAVSRLFARWNIQVELGSTATPYEPYTEGFYTEGTPEEIRVTGKNLVAGIVENASITAEGQVADTSGWQTAYSIAYAYVVSGETYTATTNDTSGLVGAYYSDIPVVGAYSSDGSRIVQASKTFTATETGYFAFRTFFGYETPQLELGSTATEYQAPHIETATASNLFAVGSVTDEQDIISGTITRRCEAVVSDGTTPSGRYIGTVGEGNIIVQTKETGYSGAIASFTADKAEPLSGLVAEINPVQDLHGYANPWPAGGGDNIFPIPVWFEVGYTRTKQGVTMTVQADGGIKLTGTNDSSSSNCDFYLSYGGDSTNLFYVPSGDYTITADGVSSDVGFVLSGGGASYNGFPYADLRNTTSLPKYKTGTVTDGTKPFSYFLIRVNPSATANTVLYIQLIKGTTVKPWTPYSNICPIYGWQGVTGQRTGKNLLQNVTGARATGSIFIGQTSSDQYPTHLFAGKTYTLQYTADVSGTIPYYKRIGGNNTRFGSGDVYTITPNMDMDVQIWVAGTGLTSVTDFQLELGSTASPYEEYTSEPISVSWQSEAGTVYSGTLDVVTGELIGTWASVDMGALNYTRTSGGGIYVYTTAGFAGKAKGVTNVKSDVFATTNVTSWGDAKPDNSICGSATSTTVVIRADAYADANALKTALNGHLAIYELATPQTYQLTPQEVDTLVGQNNVWVDTGNVSAYVPDFTTEQVAGQSLSTTEGTNTVFVTSNVDPVEIEVEYAVVPEE